MKRNQTEIYLLDELVIKLCDPAGNVIDTAVARDVGVTVEFDYQPRQRGSDDEAHVSINAIRSAGAALDGDDLAINLWANRDIQGFLMQPDIDAIKEELINRLEGREKAANDDALIDAAIADRQRPYGW